MLAIEGLEAPDDVVTVLTTIRAAIFDKNPRSALSKRCSRLREARPHVFRAVWRWLKTPSADMTDSGAEVDRRTVQRMRNRYKSCGDSLLGLPNTLRMKYPKFKE